MDNTYFFSSARRKPLKNVQLSPKSQTIQFLLSYSACLQVFQSARMGPISMILN